MKEYPKILGPYEAEPLPCIAFYKLDGSNLRFEWNRKSGWYKYGTRRQLFDASDKTYGPAVGIFLDKYGDSLIKVIADNPAYRKTESLIAYAEFFGPNSFAGWHDESDPKDVVLFDVNVHKKGFVSPEKFVEHFGHLHIPQVVYRGPFDRDFVDAVRGGEVGGFPLREGVVAKGGEGHQLWMRKVKTLAYLKELKEKMGTGWEAFWE